VLLAPIPVGIAVYRDGSPGGCTDKGCGQEAFPMHTGGRTSGVWMAQHSGSVREVQATATLKDAGHEQREQDA